MVLIGIAVGTSPSGVGVVGGIAISVVGLAETIHGTVTSGTALWNLVMMAVKKPVGSYTNTHQIGKKYHGKGTEDRMNQSAREKAEIYDDPVVDQDFTPAANDAEGFKDEVRRIRQDGGVDNPENYNKINSPGEKMLTQDGE